ncbi:hypothetical protein ACO0M4_27265 [Streptomyces sp. RGM 3693]|uniref:hypothetical protein n=1 Tax=Streptomyces sp. RGM 3693 TaxID=3413284 RepID=UPI003D2D574F
MSLGGRVTETLDHALRLQHVAPTADELAMITADPALAPAPRSLFVPVELRYLRREGYLDPDYMLVSVTKGPHFTDYDELVHDIVGHAVTDGRKCRIVRQECAPALTQEFTRHGILKRLDLRRLPTFDEARGVQPRTGEGEAAPRPCWCSSCGHGETKDAKAAWHTRTGPLPELRARYRDPNFDIGRWTDHTYRVRFDGQ